MAQLDVAGGGGSFEWLEDEPGFDAPADVGFFTLIMTATSIMNLCRTGGGRCRDHAVLPPRARGAALLVRGGNASTTDGDRRDQTGRTRLSAVQSLVYKAWRQGGGRCWGEACAHHHHEEHGVGLDGAGPRSGKAEGIRLGLEALRASAHSVAVQSVDHLLDAGPLWRILAHAVQEVVPHGHIAAAGAEAKHQCEERGARNVRGVAGARAGAHQVSFPRRAGPALTVDPEGALLSPPSFSMTTNERRLPQLTSFFPGNTEAPIPPRTAARACCNTCTRLPPPPPQNLCVVIR